MNRASPADSPPKSPPAPRPPQFVAIKAAVMRGQEHIATAVSSTMAQRIARALNRHRPNSRGF